MTKKKTHKPKKGKRGPKEERLILSDPQAAIDALLKKPAKK